MVLEIFFECSDFWHTDKLLVFSSLLQTSDVGVNFLTSSICQKFKMMLMK